MIPKVFHMVWVQGEPLPEREQGWADTWIEHNPDWVQRVWSEADYAPLLSQVPPVEEIYRTAVNHAQRAEIAQKIILWFEGGVYHDADFECFRSCGHFFEGKDLVVTWEESPGQLGNQLIGAPAGHPAVKLALDDIPRSIRWQRAQDLPQTHGAGPHLIQRLWRHGDDVEIRSSSEFFPYLWDERPPDDWGNAYGAHHWAASWKR